MAAITESRHPGEFLLSEADGTLSREVVTISDSIAIKAGQVLGKVTADGKYHFYDNADTIPGTGVAAAIALYPLAADATNRKITVIFRLAEVTSAGLEWNGQDSTSQAAARTDLVGRHVVFR